MIENRVLKYQVVTAYKYDLKNIPCLKTAIRPEKDVCIKDASGRLMISLTTDGFLSMFPSYLWDGASGCTKDSPNVMLAALGHDAKYQLMREGLIPIDPNKKIADAELENDINQETESYSAWYRTFTKVRAATWEKMVNLFAGRSTKPQGIEDNQKIITIIKGRYV